MKILLASKIDPATIDQLRTSHDVVTCFGGSEEELVAQIPGADVLVFRSGVQITRPVLQAAPTLKLLIRAGSGMDNIDLDYVQEIGLRIERIPEPGAKAVSELAFAFMLALARDLVRTDQLTRAGQWPKHQVTGRLLTGKTLGVIGYGNIGSRVGSMGHAWGMKVLGAQRADYPETDLEVFDHDVAFVSLDELLRRSDFVSIHVPLDETTRGMISYQQLSVMKPGSFLLNLARGGVVDEAALLDALVNGSRLAGAATDVHETEGVGKVSPLAHLDNVLLTPHMGSMAVEVQTEIGERVMSYVQELELLLASSVQVVGQ